MNVKGILQKVLNRIPKEAAVGIINEKTGWTPEKKPKKKEDIKEKFLELSEVIREDEIEDFVQMAVMRKNIGLPTYTYKINNVKFLENLTEEQIKQKFSIEDRTFKDVYVISTNLEYQKDMITFNFRVKEFESQWRTGVNNLTSLSAVYTSIVTLNLTNNVVSVFTGNHSIQEVLVDFMIQNFSFPITAYSLKEHTNQINALSSSVSFKTALLLDFISFRLQQKGIEANFKEIKFFNGTKNKKDGIKDVAIGGRALLASQLACEYITIGSEIVFFSTDMLFNQVPFSVKVYLKGSKRDTLKIVILDVDDEEVKSELIEIIQSEYIDMCNNGLKSVDSTKELLSTIASKYFNQDQLVNRVVQDNALKSIGLVREMTALYENQEEEEVIKLVKEFVTVTKTILDSTGYDQNDDNLNALNLFAGIQDSSVLDEDEELYRDEEAIEE
ncbi:hypothetical protein [Saccharibacillus endophyticus]|uniref:Uncharacterized protein n=1 Tax=Saccharibacillus endophyticus TaxID=2060666 RepID=A0ABQ1ZSA4_9BACL|nr:hypothetical protein [Saccharibacillus endophyticus]GGH78099.1 hypothetical protein GCM10007362_22870 [Saccharibacillus endophyticus]